MGLRQRWFAGKGVDKLCLMKCEMLSSAYTTR
ncbi:DUF4113 domain-containing protein (plasmid) [Pantoea agglomerans]|nr:DUF4113 domain-containing protein [Pantoea agglomerans]